VWARQEIVLLVREPVAVFFSLVFPVIMYVFIGIPYASTEVAPGVRFIDMMLPSLILTVVANLLLMGMPIYLAELRSRGIDRRYAALPLRGGHFVAALLLSTLVLVAGGSMIIVLVVAVRDGVRSELWSPPLLLLLAGSIVWLSALGFLLGALRVSARTTQALSTATFFLMFFGSGAAMPLDQLPEIVTTILEWNPLKQWLDVAVGVYTGTGVERAEWLRLLLALPLVACCVLVGARLWRRR
jgi:putative membrane protein